MATTTNYGWTTPDDTALVKDGASAIRTLGSSVDTTTKNLNPETTLGDLSFRSSTSNVNTRIPIGSSGQHLTVVAGVPAWATASDQTPLTTKGDLLGFSTLDARIPIGTNGHILTADSTESLGLKWAAPAGGGKVLQVVQATSTTYTAAGNTNYVDTGLSLTITPTLATSKIMIACYPVMMTYNAAAVADMNTKARIVRNVPSANTVVQEITPGYFTLATGSSTPDRSVAAIVPVVYLDAPATTSAITYKLQFGQAGTARTGSYLFFNADNQTSVVIAMEIGA